MKASPFFTYLLLGSLLALGIDASEVKAQDRKFEAQLIWGTDREKPDDPKLKPVDPDLVKRLQNVFKWKYYFQVNQVPFVVPAKKDKKVVLSDKCEVVVRDLGRPMTEVQLFGEKKLVKKITQAVAQCLVIAGDDRNDTAWFVVLTPK